VLKVICVICICLVSLPAICAPADYEPATITDVRPHVPAAISSSEASQFEVSLRVADIVYLVLYTDTLGTKTVKYAAGRQVLVHVGKDTITYNDILGRSQELPIISQKPASTTRQSK